MAAICGAVDYLGKHEFLNTYQHAGNSLKTLEQFSEYNSKFYFVSRQAIKDQNLVTANRTVALEFAELILKRFEFV
ncbi:DJ-1/PfpI family protein [Staphylococcus petrasii]|uniref:DJ-1/PfpI family protein n=1 Tax=Staphylococcus petrasii TaxID=1276936 RepID=UPI001F1CAA02|nr:DJ-1/PfpI family protein [Staphylococcus petrasii]